MVKLSEIVNQKRELLMRDTFSRPALNRSEDMSESQKDRFIDYLADRVTNLDLDKRAMELVLEDFLKTQQEMQKSMAALQADQQKLLSRLDEETRKRKAAERKAQRLDEQLKYANANRFGDKRQKVKKASDKTDDSDRNKEKEDFDGTDDTLCTDSVNRDKGNRDNQSGKKDRDLSNRPDEYKTMSVEGDPVYHPSDHSKVPGHIIESKDELKSAQFKDTIHQVCMSHNNNKFVKAANQGGEPNAVLFSNDFGELFSREHKYNELGLTPEERLRERQSLETKEIVIRIRSRLDAELAKEPEFRSQYYTEALNYLDHFWDELFAYLDDGELPIDNNLAERCIRKLTTQRNSMLHFGSDEGVEMAATYHSVISTVKLHGKSVWNYLGTFFTKIFNGCRDFFCLTPGNIEMAVCQ